MMSSLRHRPEATVDGAREVKLRAAFFFSLFFFVNDHWAGACGTRSLFLVYFFDLGTAFQVPCQHGGAR